MVLLKVLPCMDVLEARQQQVTLVHTTTPGALRATPRQTRTQRNLFTQEHCALAQVVSVVSGGKDAWDGGRGAHGAWQHEYGQSPQISY